MSTAIWTIAGLLSRHRADPLRDAERLDRARAGRSGDAAARPDGRADRRHDVVPADGRRRDRRRAALPGARRSTSRTTPGLVQFVLFLLVLVLVARISRADDAGRRELLVRAACPAGPRAPARDLVGAAHADRSSPASRSSSRSSLPLVVTQSAHHQTYAMILATAICAVSVTVLTGWGGQLSLGQMAFAGVGALSARRVRRAASRSTSAGGRTGWSTARSARTRWSPALALVVVAAIAIGVVAARREHAARAAAIAGAVAALVRSRPAALVLPGGDRSDRHAAPRAVRPRDRSSARVVACLVAVAVGVGALRVKGLLLAISTMAFAIAAEVLHLPPPDLRRPGGLDQRRARPRASSARSTSRSTTAPTTTSRSAASCSCSLLVGHLRRTGIGRAIIGVRENEPGAAAFTVSPTRAKLTAFALGGFVAGLGGALLGGLGRDDRLSRTRSSASRTRSPSSRSRSSAGSAASPARSPARCGSSACPLFWPKNQTVPLLTSSIGLLIVLLYIPGGFTQIGYSLRGAILRWLEKRLPERPAKTVTAPPVSLTRRAGAAIADERRRQRRSHRRRSPSTSAASSRSTPSTSAPMPGEVIGLIGTNGAGQVDAAQRDRRLRAEPRARSSCSARDVSRLRRAPARPRRARPHLPGRDAVPRAHRARDGAARARGARRTTSFWGSLLFCPPSIAKERAKRAEAAELIDFLGLGRYADRFIAELSTGTRRIVELASVLAVAPRVICLDEPTAGVAQREAEAFGPLIKRVQRELDATLIVVEHDLPLILSISDRIYCLEAGAVIARRRARRRAQRTRSSSRRTSAPTTARSSVRTPTRTPPRSRSGVAVGSARRRRSPRA